MNTIRSVQYLRAVAAFAVLIFHACEPVGRSFVVGSAGVDVFFVISGFILWHIAAQRQPRPGAFLLGRIIRIVPAYWAVTLAMVAASLMVANSFPRLSPEPWHVLLSLLFVPHADPHGLVFPVLAAGWTLNFEMFFYVLFALSLALPARLRLGVLVGALAGLALLGLVGRPDDPILKSATSPLLVEFAAGALLASRAAADRLPRAWVGACALALGIAVFVAQGFLPNTPQSVRLGAWGVPALLLVGGAVTVERRVGMPTLPFGLLLGDASYAIYLVHGIVVSGLVRLHLPLPFPVFLLVCAAVSIAAGVAFFGLCERPASQALRHWLLPRRRRVDTVRPEISDHTVAAQ